MVQKKPRRRHRGEGALFQRCDLKRGCPPRERVVDADGNATMERPPHACRGLWVARLELDDGRRVQRTASTQTAALKHLNAMKKEVDESGDLSKKKPIEDWYPYWLDHIAKVRPKTYDTYRSIIRAHIVKKLGKIPTNKLSAQQVREFLKGIEHLTSTRKQAYTILNQAQEAAKREGYATRNVIDLVAPPNPKGTIREGLPTSEARTVLSYAARTGDDGAPIDRLGSRWAAAFLSGQRQGECLGLEWDRVDIDWDDANSNVGWMDVSWQLQRVAFKHGCQPESKDISTFKGAEPESWPCGKKRGGSCPSRQLRVDVDYEYRQIDGGLCWVRPKSAKGKRMIPIIPSLVGPLRQRRKLYLEERKAYTTDHGLVWCRNDGSPISAGDDTEAWQALLAGAEVGTYEVHGARHTCGTLLLEAGVDKLIVMELLGHTSVAVSEGYQHVGRELKMQAMLAVEEQLAIAA